jgi:pimeloyl-ACP methyl ester carboxylesterase
MHRNILILLLAGTALRWPSVHGQVPDVASPLVSYQFHDSLSDVPDQPNVVSPLVSYQFFDWLGDENVDFISSPVVSYYFNGPPRILIQPADKALMVGQQVVLSVVADGSAPLAYQWQFNGANIADANESSIQINNAQQADSGKYSVIVENGYGSVSSKEGVLLVYATPSVPQPPAPTTVPASATPSPAQVRIPGAAPSSAQLLSFGNPALVDRSRMTIVLTHGWNATAFDWPQAMANELKSRCNANILAWDWHENSIQLLGVAASRTVAEGTALAEALMNTLGPDYDKPIHLIGHSLGTLVNCAAADYIHGDRRPKGDSRAPTEVFSPEKTHVTLFDEAELVTAVKGLHLSLDVVLATSGLVSTRWAAADAEQQIRNFWSKVMPDRFAWADNYLSEVGLLNPRAVNVMLWTKSDGLNPVAAHGYAYEWYRKTVMNPGGSVMGHRRSFEFAGALGAVSGLHSYYLQGTPELYVAPLSDEEAQKLELARLLAYPGLTAMRGINAVGKTTLQAVNVIGNRTLQVAGNVAANIGTVFSEPSGQAVYLGTAGATPAFFKETASTDLTKLEASWSLNLSMQAGLVPQQQLPPGVEAMPAPNSIGGPVYTIIPVQVPIKAVGLSFEYSISGSAVDEFMTMGINASNEYTMEAKFLDEGAWNGTPVIPVSDFRNQQVDLVFALNGVSAPPAGTLSVRNIQFYIPPRPQLNLVKNGNTLVASWPLSAIDWTIETSTDPSDPNGWGAVTEPPTASDFFRTMTFDVTETDRAFFRLRK